MRIQSRDWISIWSMKISRTSIILGWLIQVVRYSYNKTAFALGFFRSSAPLVELSEVSSVRSMLDECRRYAFDDPMGSRTAVAKNIYKDCRNRPPTYFKWLGNDSTWQMIASSRCKASKAADIAIAWTSWRHVREKRRAHPEIRTLLMCEWFFTSGWSPRPPKM